MKWWHWLILELLILFGTTTWIYFFPDEVEVNLAKGVFGFALIYFIETLRNATNDKKKTGEEKDKMFKTELDWVSAYKKLKEDNEDLKQSLDWANERESEDCKRIATLEEENKKLKKRCSHDCPSCVAFGKHCPHKVNGDPYFYDCYLTVKDLEKENKELKDDNKVMADNYSKMEQKFYDNLTKTEELTERLENATEIIELMKDLFFACWQEKGLKAIKFEQRVNDFLKEGENDRFE
jgi:hypothetical protein